MQPHTSTQPSASLTIVPTEDGLFILKGEDGLSFNVGRYFPTAARASTYAHRRGFRAVEADPILAAIEKHRAAWEWFQIAPGDDPFEGEAARASDAEDEALMTLLETKPTTVPGASALIDHLHWFVKEEASTRQGCCLYRQADALLATIVLLA